MSAVSAFDEEDDDDDDDDDEGEGADGDADSGEAPERGPQYNFGHRRTRGLDNHTLPTMRLCLLAAVSRRCVCVCLCLFSRLFC